MEMERADKAIREKDELTFLLKDQKAISLLFPEITIIR
tara:strand:- start:1142 stop:1255 length:114 start_codon:yes stop_codon:yes gene_type:complete